MRASRLLSILTTLQARGRATAQSLADDCEVSVRTIYRDVDALSAAGVPIYAERGGAGGYRLLDGYRTRLNGLSAAEAEVLFFAGLPRQAAELGLGSVAASARSKLLAALPVGMRDEAGRMGARFHLDAPGWFVEDDASPHLPTLAEAVRADRAVRLRYRSWRAEVERRVEPLGLVLKGGAWYLVAGVEGSVRTYRVSRIRELTETDEVFARPSGFDLAAHWAASTRTLEAELHPHPATLRMTGLAIRMMEAFLPPYVRGTAQIGDPDAEGRRIVRLRLGAVSHAAYDLLRFGPEIEVLEPPELRERMASLGGEIRALYEPAPPPDDFGIRMLTGSESGDESHSDRPPAVAV